MSVVQRMQTLWRRLSGDGSGLVQVIDDARPWPGGDRVAAIAHNAGDSLDATAHALRHGAAVIEIDVVACRGRLYAGHRTLLPWVGPWLFRRPSLEYVWAASAPVALMLDLKEASPPFLELLFAFLEVHGGERLVIVVSGRPSTLRAFQQRMPWVVRLYGASPPGRLEAFRQDEALIALVDGLNLRHDRIDAEIGSWADARGLWLVAWTVNDFERGRQLIGYGVDAITTDNLAIMAALGGDVAGTARRKKIARHNTNPVG